MGRSCPITKAIARDIRRRMDLDPHYAEIVYAIPLTVQNAWVLAIRFDRMWSGIDIDKIGTKDGG